MVRLSIKGRLEGMEEDKFQKLGEFKRWWWWRYTRREEEMRSRKRGK